MCNQHSETPLSEKEEYRDMSARFYHLSKPFRIVLRLAQSWERSGNLKKAIAVAWTAVPMTKSTEQDVAELLALIIRNAKKIGAQDDLQDAMDLQ